MYVPQEFDFIKLMALGRDGAGSDGGARVAVLGFCTTQYYAAVLRGLSQASGFPIRTYEPEYNTVHQTVLDRESALYAFRPDAVIVLTAVQALRTPLLSVGMTERVEAAEREAGQLVTILERLCEIPGVTVVVNEFVVPYERPWGNLTRRVEASFPNLVRRINGRLRRLAADVENLYTLDTDHAASWIGKRAWFDERLWFHSKSFCHPEALPHVAGEALDIVRAAKGRNVKCVVLDLDNVLWGGTVGDDGVEGIRVGDLGEGEAFVHFQTWLRELRARGILLGVCSKNDDEKAREPFRRHDAMVLREDDFSCFIANWDDKAGNLRQLASRLNIGLDSLVFIDDSAFERNLVRTLAPDVCVPEIPEDPAEFVPYLESLNLFETTQFSDEDRKRADFYRANVLREEEQTRFADVGEYLASLRMEAEFERFDDVRLPRIAQLVQRTNQFNVTTIRHSAAELKEFAENPDYFPFYVTLADRFGDNGLISVVIGKRAGTSMVIVTWLMSCRVISRRLEEFVLDQLVEIAQADGMRELRARYVPTRKNGLVAGLFERLGFAPAETRPDGSSTWFLDVGAYEPSDAPIARRALLER